MAGADDIDAVLAKLRAPIVADLAKKFPNLTGQQRDALAHWGMRAADEAAGDRKMSKGPAGGVRHNGSGKRRYGPGKGRAHRHAETTPFCQKDGTLYVLEGAKSSESTSVIVAGFAVTHCLGQR
ncbi:MAG: hypothetical protein WDN72_00895 [Alphaproteobacteria bacterium]